jgi:pimeloyl-ACP methyl ester carboxylesterase
MGTRQYDCAKRQSGAQPGGRRITLYQGAGRSRGRHRLRSQATYPPIIVWGSGYSASLVFLLAASHPDTIDAVLAFSPAENFQGASVSEAAAKVRCTVFVTSSSDPGEIGDAKKVLEAVDAGAKAQLVPQRREANPCGAVENWSAVQAFLASLGKKPTA